MFVRLNIGLRPDEKQALEGLAIQERRRVEAQAAWIIRQELERLGLIASEAQNTTRPELAVHGQSN